jgi:hypothetical protein
VSDPRGRRRPYTSAVTGPLNDLPADALQMGASVGRTLRLSRRPSGRSGACPRNMRTGDFRSGHPRLGRGPVRVGVDILCPFSNIFLARDRSRTPFPPAACAAKRRAHLARRLPRRPTARVNYRVTQSCDVVWRIAREEKFPRSRRLALTKRRPPKAFFFDTLFLIATRQPRTRAKNGKVTHLGWSKSTYFYFAMLMRSRLRTAGCKHRSVPRRSHFDPAPSQNRETPK